MTISTEGKKTKKKEMIDDDREEGVTRRSQCDGGRRRRPRRRRGARSSPSLVRSAWSFIAVVVIVSTTLLGVARVANAQTDVPTKAPVVVAPPAPASTVVPTDAPTTKAPTKAPTDVPTTNSPTASPTTTSPTKVPTTEAPTKAPTPSPTTGPPTDAPTRSPTDPPTKSPTDPPTVLPTDFPTVPPTDVPTVSPTVLPTVPPTGSPTIPPTTSPSSSPSTPSPTSLPTESPTVVPSVSPTTSPTESPSSPPSNRPTETPTTIPTIFPSENPTIPPTIIPSVNPTLGPSSNPHDGPTVSPSGSPSQSPTVIPSDVPSVPPTISPSDNPSVPPTRAPWDGPSDAPSGLPTSAPSVRPSETPTVRPSRTPTEIPTARPTGGQDGCPTNFTTDLDPTGTISYGILFSIQSKTDKRAVILENFRFLTSSDVTGEALTYSLYTRETAVGSPPITMVGSTTSMGWTPRKVDATVIAGEGDDDGLTTIPNFVANLGPNRVLTFYLVLKTQDLKYAFADPSKSDLPQQSSDWFDLMPGIGVMKNNPGNDPGSYADHRNFIGGFEYHVLGLPCKYPTASPSSVPSIVPTVGPSLYPSRDPTHPTPYPTVSIEPTIEPKITYPPNPPPRKWTTNLGVGSTTRKGNAVTLSPDQGLLYVTSSDGTLKVLYAVDGTTRAQIDPNPYDAGWTTECESGVYFGRDSTTGTQFGVYAVRDVMADPVPADFVGQSRVYAISHPDNELLWTSPPLPGIISGTPVVTSDGSYVYLTRNTDSLLTSPEGHFTILNADDGSIRYTENAGMKNETDVMPYGPLTIVHNPTGGHYQGGEFNRQDLAIWHTSSDEGSAKFGHTRIFQLPSFYNPDALISQPLQTRRMDDKQWSVATKPTLTSDGLKGFFSATRGELKGWTTRKYSNNADWSRELTPLDPNLLRKPLPVSPVLNRDETILYVPSPTTTFYAINVTDGSTVWSAAGTSYYSTEAKMSRNVLDDRVYLVQKTRGVVQCRDARNGTLHWHVFCGTYTFDVTCADDVVSEFALSDDGHDLYYVTSNGEVTALSVSFGPKNTPAPTDYPTRSPVTSAPSFRPSDGPTRSPSSDPTVVPSASPTHVPTVSTIPTKSPWRGESDAPSNFPTTDVPTRSPSSLPSSVPTTEPPSSAPSDRPSDGPVEDASEGPPPLGGDGDGDVNPSGVNQLNSNDGDGDGSDGGGLSSAGRAALIAVGTVAGVMFVALLVLLAIRRKKNREFGVSHATAGSGARREDVPGEVVGNIEPVGSREVGGDEGGIATTMPPADEASRVSWELESQIE